MTQSFWALFVVLQIHGGSWEHFDSELACKEVRAGYLKQQDTVAISQCVPIPLDFASEAK